MIKDLPIKLIKLEDESFHILVEAEIASHTAWLIIDTGASRTVFDSTFVSEFIQELEDVEGADSSGVNAMINQTQTGIIPEVALGPLIIKDYKTVIMDLSHVNTLYMQHVNMEIAGLIGSDFLVKYEAVLDYGQQRMSLNF